MPVKPTAPSAASPAMQSNLEGVRIARVSTVAYFLVTQLKAQVEGLVVRGAELTLICSPGPELKQLRLGPRLRYLPVNIERSIRPLHDLRALWQLFRLFRRDAFDIVHSTTPKAGLVAGLAALLAGVPVRVHTYTGQVWMTRRGLAGWLARMGDRVIAWVVTQAYADSPSQRDFLVAQGIVAAHKIAVIKRGSLAGVDIKRFDPQRFTQADRQQLRSALGIAPSTAILLFIGRIVPEKGLHELLKAFTTLREQGLDVALLLVGPLNDECGGEASLSAAALQAQAGVYYVGFSPEPERYMASADVLCLPSYREGFGTVVIEAAALGLPTVGTHIVGLTDAIEAGVTGLLVAPRSAPALTAALHEILTTPGLKRALGDAARARCLSDFEANKLTSALADEYQRLLGQVKK